MSTFEVEVVYTVEADTWEEAEQLVHDCVSNSFKTFDEIGIVDLAYGEIHEV